MKWSNAMEAAENEWAAMSIREKLAAADPDGELGLDRLIDFAQGRPFDQKLRKVLEVFITDNGGEKWVELRAEQLTDESGNEADYAYELDGDR